AELHERPPGARRGGHRPAVPGPGGNRPAPVAQHQRNAAQRPGRRAAVPRRQGTGKNQRIPALTSRVHFARSIAMAERTVFQSIAHRHVVSLGPQASVWEAACAMTRANCCSVLILDTPGTMLGIVTERDLTTRVLAKALDPKTTT